MNCQRITSAWILLVAACGGSNAEAAAASSPAGAESHPSAAAAGDVELIVLTPLPIPEYPAGDPFARDPAAPEGMHDAWRALHELGFPNVSGLQYRHVVLTSGSVWHDQPSPRRTHAWVLRPPDRDGVGWVIAWDGLVYATRAIGPTADLDADLLWAVQYRSALGGEYPPRDDFDGFDEFVGALVLYGSGRGDLARVALGPHRVDVPAIVTQWLALRFQRLVVAHMNGDDSLARADADWFASAEPLFEPIRQANRLEFLNALPRIAADLERRAVQPSAPIDPSRLHAAAAVAPDLPRLVEALDQLRVPQRSTHSVPFRHSLPVLAIVRRGAAAIEPLLIALVEDERLTRSYYMTSDFAGRVPLPVAEPIYAALVRIVEPPFAVGTADDHPVQWLDRSGREELAARFRLYIERFGAAPGPERWLAMLAADDADPGEWEDAARHVVAPQALWQMGRALELGVPPPSELAAPEVLAGEPLRADHGEEITALLQQRLRQTTAARDMPAACVFAEALCAWSPRESEAVLADFERRCVRPGRECACAGELALALAPRRGGASLGRFRRWLEAGPVNAARVARVLAPLVERPEHPEMIAAAQWVASSESGVMTPEAGDLVVSRAFELAPVRERVLVELADTTSYGTARRAGDAVVVSYSSGTLEIPDPEGQLLGDGSAVVRVCDLYAWHVSRRTQTPFSFAWDPARRDRAAAEIRARVTAYTAGE